MKITFRTVGPVSATVTRCAERLLDGNMSSDGLEHEIESYYKSKTTIVTFVKKSFQNLHDLGLVTSGEVVIDTGISMYSFVVEPHDHAAEAMERIERAAKRKATIQRDRVM